MNKEQWLSILRDGVKVICGILVARGAFTAEQAPIIETLLMTVIPILVGIAVSYWGQHTHGDASVVATIANMPQEKAAQAVASLPAEQKAQMTLAATPDKAIIAAVNAMPEVTKILVTPTATAGVGQALADPKLEKVLEASPTK